MIAVDRLCAPGAADRGDGQRRRTPADRPEPARPGRSLSCYGPLPRTRHARRLRRADIIRVARGAEGSLPEARP